MDRVIHYKEFVDKDSITIDCDNLNYRYSLTIPFNREGEKSGLVIMMNPSKATDKISDNTINNVLTRIYNECPDVSKITITNLYPLYETYSEKLEYHNEQSRINFKKMETAISQSDFVLLGWGKPTDKNNKDLQKMKYHEHALKAVELVQSLKVPAFKVGDLRDDLFPKHLGRQSFNLKMSKIDLGTLAKKINKKIKV